MSESLTELGLNKNEIAVYIFLVQTGKTTYTNITQSVEISVPLVKTALKSLLEKKLIEKINFGAKQYYYFASNPQNLSNQVNADISKKQEALENTMKELKLHYQCNVENNAKIIFYNGVEGIKNHWKRLRDKKVKLIRSIFNQDFVFNRNTKRSEKDTVLKGLYRDIIFTSKEKPETILDGEHYAPYNEWKDITAEVGIYKNTVMFMYGKSKKKAFLIENNDIAKTMTVLYEMAKKGIKKTK